MRRGRGIGSVGLSPVAEPDGTGQDGPWLRLNVEVRAFAGRWIRITYRTSLLDPLVRPLLRCVGPERTVDRVLNAALFGRAIWLGRIPEGTTELRVSPTDCGDGRAFAIDRIDIPSGFALGCGLLRRSPTAWFIWMFAPLVGLGDASDVQVRRVLSPTPVARYDAWRRARTRPFDYPGFDGAPKADDGRVRFVTRARAGEDGVLSDLVAVLARQPFPHWSLVVVQAPEPAQLPATAPRHLIAVPAGAGLDELAAGLSDSDVLVPFALDGSLPDYAAAVFARAGAEVRDASWFFADSDRVDAAGRFCGPRWRSDEDRVGLDPGTVLAIRVGTLRATLHGFSAGEVADLPATLSERPRADLGRPHHIRRVLRTVRGPEGARTPPMCPEVRQAMPREGFRATIIIPTKDRLDLLGRCVASLKTTDGFDRTEVVIVDNGSTREETRSFLSSLVADPRFRVVTDDGPFNFSRLCNAGAARARAPVLVFLNNDTEVVDPAWLDRMLDWTGRPDVGAVGAKLLYPGGRVQHAGVVLGIDGLAGHFERGVGRDDPGFFGRLTVPHAVSSVTAACLAVETRKFEAVGGFDEANLPVDLNDVDLCLRLGARGWTAVLQPAAVLLHHESASRGVSLNPDVVYRGEQAVFRARWWAKIRDDPHFHAALSLDSLDARLG